MFDENRIEDTVRASIGRIRDAIASLTGDVGPQAAGKADQAAGSTRDTFGAALEATADWRGKLVAFTRDKPLTALLAAVSTGYVLHMTMRPARR